MLSIFTELGRSEEFFSDLVYPVWPVWLAGAIALVAAIGFVAIRRGWHQAAIAHPLATAGVALAIAAVAAYPA